MLCFASFISQQRNIVQLQNCIKRNIVIQQQINWYASTYSRRSVELIFIWKENTADWIQSAGLIVIV